jgi:hypothetical protein
MTKKYKYKVQEYSQDTRHFFIESAVELDEDEITECVSSADFNEYSKTGLEINGSKVYVSFKGTEYGDDSQINISEVK